MLKVNGIEVKKMVFPDGQPHIYLDENIIGSEFALITCSIRNSEELLNLALTHEVVSRYVPKQISLDITYLMGARMDRAIDETQPFTLKTVCNIINSMWWSNIRIFHAHSEVAPNLLRAQNIMPSSQVMIARIENPNAVCIAPDKGSAKWVGHLVGNYVGCEKTRDSQSGKLSGFTVLDPEKVNRKECLIIDDLCDGGGTFVGIASELRKAGATKVILYVSHGIFSKGFDLPGIEKIYTTDSYRNDYPVDKITMLKSL